MAFRYLAIEGPIGSARRGWPSGWRTKLEATTVLEDTENPFLADFYADRPAPRCRPSSSTCSTAIAS